MDGYASLNNTTSGLCFFITQNNNTTTSHLLSTIFSILGLTSNFFAFCVLLGAYRRTQSRSRSSFLIFLCGLVVTDFAGLLVTSSIVLTYYYSKFIWKEVDPNCNLCNFMGLSMVFFGLCPLLLGATMAIERFMGINRPFSRSSNISKRRALCTVISVLAFACFIGILPIMGLGHYRLQYPMSWCFFSITPEPMDQVFSLIFSLVGLLSIVVSILLNTVSVVCCDRECMQRRRDHEVEMMVQLLGIMVIASVCWCPLLIFIAQAVASNESTVSNPTMWKNLLLYIRIVTWNQILDPWVYILFRRAVLRRVYPSLGRTRASIMSMYPMMTTSLRRKLTRVESMHP
ncbi:TA2R protein, partial [Polyodon spathula]|nr:TA2R protein [Polyodon spathula]